MDQHKLDLAVPVDRLDHIRGADHALVTIVEYGDFECPHCKAIAPMIGMLMERYPKKLRMAFRHFPQEGVHPHALKAAEAAEAAGAQGKFWPMHDLLFANQSHLKPNNLRSYAEQLELDMTRFDAEMEDEVYLQRVREHIEGGRRSGMRATPGIFLDGILQDTSFGLQKLVRSIGQAAERA